MEYSQSTQKNYMVLVGNDERQYSYDVHSEFDKVDDAMDCVANLLLNEYRLSSILVVQPMHIHFNIDVTLQKGRDKEC